MLTILNITSPIFLLIGLGFGAVRVNILGHDQMRPLGIFVINFSLPALIFNALAKRPVADLFNFELLIAYSLASFAVVVGALFIICFIQKQSLRKTAILAMGMSLSNSAFLGFPIAQQIIGDRAGAMLAVYVVVENLVILPLLLMLADFGDKNGNRLIARLGAMLGRLLKNPLILAIVFGVIFAAAGLNLAGAPSRAIDMLSNASAPVALFCIGGTLAGLKLKGMAVDISSVVLSKLVMHPLAVMAIFLLYPIDDPTLRDAAIINAGMPMATIYPLLAQKYGQENFCSAALVVTTATSFMTINALIWIIYLVSN